MHWRETPAITAIAGGTILISVAITLAGLTGYAAYAGGFIPALASGGSLPAGFGASVPWWLTPLTATLVHGGFVHLALNMVMLVYCGQQAERALGARGLVALYGLGAFAAALGQFVQDPASVSPMIGASGAISAVVAAYALLFGQRRAKALGPVSANVMHVLWLAAAWIGIQLMIGVAGLGGTTQIAIGAHIGGFLAGLALTRPLLLWRYRGA